MTQSIAVASARPPIAVVGSPTPPTQPTMAARWWGIEWPAWSCGEVSVERVTFEAGAPFMARHYPSIFASEPDRFLAEAMTEAKRRFLAEADVFLFRKAGADVGICIAHPSDWSTYYVRSMALLPEIRDHGLAQQWSDFLSTHLRAAGVQRMEAETAPTNVPMQRLFLGTGWVPTGSVNSERWGVMLRYTLFLQQDAQRAFERQFIGSVSHSRRDRTST